MASKASASLGQRGERGKVQGRREGRWKQERYTDANDPSQIQHSVHRWGQETDTSSHIAPWLEMHFIISVVREMIALGFQFIRNTYCTTMDAVRVIMLCFCWSVFREVFELHLCFGGCSLWWCWTALCHTERCFSNLWTFFKLQTWVVVFTLMSVDHLGLFVLSVHLACNMTALYSTVCTNYTVIYCAENDVL